MGALGIQLFYINDNMDGWERTREVERKEGSWQGVDAVGVLFGGLFVGGGGAAEFRGCGRVSPPPLGQTCAKNKPFRGLHHHHAQLKH